MKRWLTLLFLGILALNGCKQPVPREVPERAVKPKKVVHLDVKYRFLNKVLPRNGDSELGIVCLADAEIKADITFSADNIEWVPLAQKIQTKKHKDTIFALKYKWKMPPMPVDKFWIRISAVSTDGRRGKKTFIIECVSPRSKVTFDPFSI